MPNRIAGIDVHKRMLAIVVADAAAEGEFQFERRQFSSSPDQLQSLAAWLIEREVQEVVMESTAQYWKPVWRVLERRWKPACQQRDTPEGSAAFGAGQIQSRTRWAQA